MNKKLDISTIEDDYLSCKKSAEVIGVSLQYIHFWIKSKKLEDVIKCPCKRTYLIPKTSIKKLIEEEAKLLEQKKIKLSEIEL